MLRTTPATAELAIPALVNTIKAHLAKAAQAADKAEQHYITAGLRLKELKLRKPSATPWPEYVRETFGLGQQRADELIRIADGRTTVEAVHASQKIRDAKRRPSKSNVGHIESQRLKAGEFRRLDGRVQADDSDKVSPEVKAAADDAKLTSKQRLVVACLPDVAEQLIAKMAGNPTPVDDEPKTSEPVDSGMTLILSKEWQEPLVTSGKYLGVPVAEYVAFLLVLGQAAFNRKFQKGLTSQMEWWLVDMHSKYPDTFNVGSWEGSCGHLSIGNLRAKADRTEPTAAAKPVSDVTHAAEPKRARHIEQEEA